MNPLKIVDMNEKLTSLISESRKVCVFGKKATYIPALEKVDENMLSISLSDIDGNDFQAGDSSAIFTIQSISKVFSILLALNLFGDREVFKRVGLEPSGDRYNSIKRLEVSELGKPYNPMINPGAIVISDMLRGFLQDKAMDYFLSFIHRLTGRSRIDTDGEVFRSEKLTGNRNRSLAYFLQDMRVLDEAEKAVDFYFHQCSVKLGTKDLARFGALLANNGVSPITGEQIIRSDHCRITKALMLTCGMYDASGELAVRIGLPTKSGVSGGILACSPGKMGIGIFSPPLDGKGNSMGGVHLLEKLSRIWNLSIFE